MIRALLERGSVIGAVLDDWMIIPGWERRVTTPESADLHLDQWVDHIDHICQIAGHAGQAAIRPALDGGFGNNQTPLEIQTIADLQKVPDLLQKRGFSAADIDGIFHGNWLRFLKKHWK